MTLPSAVASPAMDLEVQTIDPSTVIVDAEAVVVPDANAADPSPVDKVDAKEPPSLLDVVKSAVEPVAEVVVPSSPEGDPVEPAAAEPAVVAEEVAEDDANLPFHNHPRWKAVIAERDSLKDPAERWGYITGFMQEHGLSSEEVAEGYEIMALLKSGDPVKLAEAREWFSTRLDGLDQTLGNVLPDDLIARIEAGTLDEEGATELAQARAATALRETRAASEATATAAERGAADATALTNSMVAAVEGWETRTKATDPDFSKKAQPMLDRCSRIVAAEGAPRTAAAAEALAKRAYEEISTEFKALLPKPRAIALAPTGQSTPAAAAPKTLLDAVKGAVGAS